MIGKHEHPKLETRSHGLKTRVTNGLTCITGFRPVLTPFKLPLIFATIICTDVQTFAAETERASAKVSFKNDVMAVLANSGCNAGACHGNKSGKGGFKLSLRGQDPDADYDALTRDLFARRTNPLDPDQSLMLLKATGRIPHEGGARFTRDSQEYRLIRGWIDAGVPRDPAGTPAMQKLQVTPSGIVLNEPNNTVQVKATAVFSDGSRRDVTRLCLYEQSADIATISRDGLVRVEHPGETAVIVTYLRSQEVVRVTYVPKRESFVWKDIGTANLIDEHVFAKLRSLRLNPSGACTDLEYLRRAYLDLLGLIPTADEARAFAADTSASKRAKLIDKILARPEYADAWAQKWDDLLRVEERTLDRKGVEAIHGWIRKSIADNKPLDEFCRELVAARGSTYTVPPANYYRALRDPVTRGEAAAQVFMGVRLQCAQCHNHPFDRWTQDDYFSWADVFSRIDYKIIENKRKDNNDSHEFVGEQIVLLKTEGTYKDARGIETKPRLLGTAGPMDEGKDRLDSLAAWMTGPDNKQFARAQANRIWANLMGRGIVDPVDDFRATNPASHPELLEALAAELSSHKFDARHLIRLIMSSKTYALSSEPAGDNASDEINYSHVIPRRLSAEQLLDSQHQVAGVPTEFAGYPKGTRASQIAGVQAVRPRDEKPTNADKFLVTFGKPPRLLSCDCERSNDTTLSQVFNLVTGPEMLRIITSPDNIIGNQVAAGATDEQIVTDLSWSALTRAPKPEELKTMTDHIRKAPNRRQGLEDVLWAMLNAKEFILRK